MSRVYNFAAGPAVLPLEVLQEAQKELVKQSIAETQHLLDSRMDYYFD